MSRMRAGEGQPEQTKAVQEFLAQRWRLGVLSKKAKPSRYSALEK